MLSEPISMRQRLPYLPARSQGPSGMNIATEEGGDTDQSKHQDTCVLSLNVKVLHHCCKCTCMGHVEHVPMKSHLDNSCRSREALEGICTWLQLSHDCSFFVMSCSSANDATGNSICSCVLKTLPYTCKWLHLPSSLTSWALQCHLHPPEVQDWLCHT